MPVQWKQIRIRRYRTMQDARGHQPPKTTTTARNKHTKKPMMVVRIRINIRGRKNKLDKKNLKKTLRIISARMQANLARPNHSHPQTIHCRRHHPIDMPAITKMPISILEFTSVLLNPKTKRKGNRNIRATHRYQLWLDEGNPDYSLKAGCWSKWCINEQKMAHHRTSRVDVGRALVVTTF